MTVPGPLAGRRIIVTRGLDKADRLARLLRASGATVVGVPMIATEPLPASAGLAAAVARLGSGGWVVLTSAVAVGLLATAVGEATRAVNVAVVGPATAAAARRRGLPVTVVAPGQVAESLAAELTTVVGHGDRVLILAAAGGRDVVARELRSRGALVEVVTAYRSVLPAAAPAALRAALEEAPVDAVTFTSGSTVRHFMLALGDAVPPSCAAVCIGPVTAHAARRAGWSRVITATEHTAAGLAAAVCLRVGTAHPLP